MKKSLVISTIATVLVVVVALTTATFAWFSAQSVTQLSSDFTVGATSGTIQLSRWLPGEEATAGNYEGPLSEEWTLGDNSAAAYEFTYTTDGEVDGDAATVYPATGYNPLAPMDELDRLTFAPNSGTTINKDGLPGVNFTTATVAGSTTTYGSTSLHAVAVRFQLTASQFAQTDATVMVTISVPSDAPTPSDYNAAANARVYLAGAPLNGDKTALATSATNQGFVVATDYSYVTDTDLNTTEDVTFTNSSTTAAKSAATVQSSDVTYDAAVTDNDVIAKIESGRISQYATTFGAASQSAAAAANFRVTAGIRYDCVLYIWLDGVACDDASSLGRFTVDIQFDGTEVVVGP